MEILAPSEIISLSVKENEVLSVPSAENKLIIPFKEAEKNPTDCGSLFQKTCSSCQAPSKYQCPKCSTLSCSMECVKAHKIEKECNGERDPTSFIAVEDFKDKDFFSDYHFLEEAQRCIDSAERGKKGKGLLHGHLPINLAKLQMAARQRKTDLQILPLVFAKRKQSTTYLRYSDRKIFWRLEWEFPHVEFTCADDRVDEDRFLGDCVDEYVNANSTKTNKQLSYYHLLSHQDIAVLLRDENCPSNVVQYHLLEQRKTLRTNFKHLKIIEYPTLLVVSKIHLSCFQIVNDFCVPDNEIPETLDTQ